MNDFTYHKIIKDIENLIISSGFCQYDFRLNRKTMVITGNEQSLIISKDELVELRTKPLEKKYINDWKRILNSFLITCNEAINNPTSRRLMIFNDENYFNEYQCFTHLQFVLNSNNNYTLIIYQRSSDIKKLFADICFFGFIINHFEIQTKYEVDELKILFAHIHTEYEYA